MFKPEHCIICGHGPLDIDFMDDNGIYRCDVCAAARAAGDLLRLARDGRTDRFLEELAEEGKQYESVVSNICELLIREASEYAARGDYDEAKYRLRLAAEPKFKSVTDCQVALVYDQAHQENLFRENAA
jgi:hypothetical protein